MFIELANLGGARDTMGVPFPASFSMLSTIKRVDSRLYKRLHIRI